MLRLLPLLLLPLLVAATESLEPQTEQEAADLDPNADCPAPRPGTLTLATVPWTVVEVDGVVVGTTPLFRFELPAGPHKLTLTNAGAAVAVVEDVVVEEGRAHKLKLVLATDSGEAVLDDKEAAGELECIADDEAAYVTVDTRPWSKVWIDGRLVGVTPVFRHKVAAGAHAVRVMTGAGELRAARFQAAAGEVVKVQLAINNDAVAPPPPDAAPADATTTDPADDGLDVR